MQILELMLLLYFNYNLLSIFIIVSVWVIY